MTALVEFWWQSMGLLKMNSRKPLWLSLCKLVPKNVCPFLLEVTLISSKIHRKRIMIITTIDGLSFLMMS
jgi:hypothetical protein